MSMKDSIYTYLKTGKRNITISFFALVIIVLGTFPFYSDVDSFFAYYLFLCFVYIILAQGWNLVAGYTGQISLGTHAFFALGAYTTAIIWLHDITKTWYYFDPVVMVLSGIVSAIFAIFIGILLVSRLRIVILRGGKFTEGAMGLRIPADDFTSMHIYYWTALLLAILATAVVYFLTRSRIGLALKAIREDEMSAASHGVHILKYKVLAFAIGAFITGVCGSLFTYYLFMINPLSVMNLNWMFLPILICVLGGNGTIFGPIIGAFIVGLLFSYGDVYVGQVHPMLSGIIIILVMKFMPTGIIGLTERISPRR
jgi:branched-chain amino acid transport system permease protein